MKIRLVPDHFLHLLSSTPPSERRKSAEKHFASFFGSALDSHLDLNPLFHATYLMSDVTVLFLYSITNLQIAQDTKTSSCRKSFSPIGELRGGGNGVQVGRPCGTVDPSRAPPRWPRSQQGQNLSATEFVCFRANPSVAESSFPAGAKSFRHKVFPSTLSSRPDSVRNGRLHVVAVAFPGSVGILPAPAPEGRWGFCESRV